MNFAKCVRTPFSRTTSGRRLLSIVIIRLEYLKLNLRKMRATIFWSLTTTFKWPPLIYDRIITPQFIKQYQHIRIKPSHMNSYHGDIIPNHILNHKAKIIIFFIIDHEELQKMFEVNYLAHLKVGGWFKKLVIVKTSVKYEMKYTKLPPNFHFTRSSTDFD